MAAIEVLAILGLGASCAGWGVLQRWAARHRSNGTDPLEGCGGCGGSCEREEAAHSPPDGEVKVKPRRITSPGT
jgi:hypothetical protein